MRGVWNLRAISETYIRLMEITLILAALVWASVKTGHPILWAAFIFGFMIFLGHMAKVVFDLMIWGVAQLRETVTLSVSPVLFRAGQLTIIALIAAFIFGYLHALIALAKAIQT